MNMRHFWDDRGNQKNGQSLDTHTLPSLPNFQWAFVRMDPTNVSAKFAVRSFTRSWGRPTVIAIAVLGWACEPPILGNGRMVPFERALVSSYRPSIVTFYLSLRVSEILPLLCFSRPLFPTPPLVSPKFPHVPLGVGEWPLGYEVRRCWLIIHAISFQDFQRM